MNYSIKYAKKGTFTLWLDKSGNKYTVGDFDTIKHTHTFIERFDRFDDANERFLKLCAEYGMEPEDVIHDDFPTFD